MSYLCAGHNVMLRWRGFGKTILKAPLPGGAGGGLKFMFLIKQYAVKNPI